MMSGYSKENVNMTQRNAIWESICEKLNAVGKTKEQPMKVREDGRT